MLLQATKIRNTEWVLGMVIYAGNNSKFSKNKDKPPTKFTQTDSFIMEKLALSIFCFQLVLACLIFGITGVVWKEEWGRDMWYFAFPTSSSEDPWYEPMVIPIRFLLLNSLFIPISLKVTLDFAKLGYAYFVNNDMLLYDEVTDTKANANSTALGEELGQVEYVLTDKTGTLTQNVMVFAAAWVAKAGAKSAAAGGGTSGVRTCLEGGGVSPAPGMRPGVDTGGKVYSSHMVEEFAVRAEALGGETCTAEDAAVTEFLRVLALCHDLDPSAAGEQSPGQVPKYEGASPDEIALADMAARGGVVYQNKEGALLSLRVAGKVERFELVCVLKFNSVRKRMSVLLRVVEPPTRATRDGPYLLLTKGADDTVLPLLRAGEDTQRHVAEVTEQLEHFSMQGLRTLVVASKTCSDAEVQTWLKQHHEASTVTGDAREDAVDGVYTLLEQGLTLVGATAIEDLLQDEVGDTISLMREAGLRFWMLTGDKSTTARQIATMCKLTNTGHNTMMVSCVVDGKTGESRVIVDEGSVLASLSEAPRPAQGASFQQQLRDAKACMEAFERTNGQAGIEPEIFVLVDAVTLEMLLEEMLEEFSSLAIRPTVKSVLCCRVTPKQKGRVVKMVKDAGYVTLAVGDGGNDVPMIQEAHLGVGIVGKEGLQAARAADYSIAKFMFLSRLVLVHGHWAYHRTCFIAQYSFYRCFFFCMFQLSFNTHAGYSGSSWFLSLPITLFNAPLTGLSSFFFVLDRDVSARTLLNKESYRHHRVYKHGIDGDYMNLYTILGWLTRGCLQGIVSAWLVSGIYGTGEHDGTVMDAGTTSMVAYSVVICALTISVFMESSTVTWMNHLVMV